MSRPLAGTCSYHLLVCKNTPRQRYVRDGLGDQRHGATKSGSSTNSMLSLALPVPLWPLCRFAARLLPFCSLETTALRKSSPNLMSAGALSIADGVA